MANFTIGIFADSGSGIQIVNGGSNSSPIDVQRGDTVTFSNFGGSGISVNVGSFSSLIFTNTSSVSVNVGSSATKTVKSNASFNVVDQINVSATGEVSKQAFVRCISATDTNPDDFSSDLVNITNGNPNTEYLLGEFTVSGINTQVTMSVSGNANPESKVGADGAQNSNNKTVQNGSQVGIFATTANAFSTSRTATITIGDRTVTKTLTTAGDGSTGTVGDRIPFHVTSGTVSIDDLRDFFGPQDETSLQNYYRGGSYVPNITTGSPNNSGVPVSGNPIDMNDFYDSFTTIFFSTQPPTKQQTAVTTSSPAHTFSWNKTEWALGFGTGMKDNVDYRIVHETTFFEVNLGSVSTYNLQFNGVTRDLTVATNRSSFTSTYNTTHQNFSDSVSLINVAIVGSSNSEGIIAGEIELQARHKQDTSFSTSSTFQYIFFFFGV